MFSIIIVWVGRGMVMPFTIIFFTQIVGLEGGIVGGGIAAASILGLTAVTVTAGLIDRVGGKPVLVSAIVIMGVAYTLLAWAESIWPYLIFTMFFYIASQSYWPAIDSLTASLAYEGKVITAFSMVRVGNAVGIGTGGLLGGVLVSGGGLVEYRVMFIVAGLLFIAGAAVIWFVVPAPKIVDRNDGTDEPDVGWSYVLRDRTFLYGMLLLFVLVLGFTQMSMSVPPFLRAEAGASEGYIGLLFFMNTVAVIALQVPIASRVDRGNTGVLLAVAALFWAGAFGLMLLTVDTASAAVLVFASFTLGELLFMPLTAVVPVRLAPVHLRGRYFSMLSMTWGASAAIATLVAGLIQDVENAGIIWPIMAAIMVLAAGAALRLRNSKRLQHEPFETPLPGATPAPANLGD